MAPGRAGGSRPGRTPRPCPTAAAVGNGQRFLRKGAGTLKCRPRMCTALAPRPDRQLVPRRPLPLGRQRRPAGCSGCSCVPVSRAASAEGGGTGCRSPIFVLLAEARTPATSKEKKDWGVLGSSGAFCPFWLGAYSLPPVEKVPQLTPGEALWHSVGSSGMAAFLRESRCFLSARVKGKWCYLLSFVGKERVVSVM